MTRVQPGEYEVRPILAGYDFNPPAQAISIPPDGDDVDFTAEAWHEVWTAGMPIVAANQGLWWAR